MGVPAGNGGDTIVCGGGKGLGASAEVDGGASMVVFGIGPAGDG